MKVKLLRPDKFGRLSFQTIPRPPPMEVITFNPLRLVIFVNSPPIVTSPSISVQLG